VKLGEVPKFPTFLESKYYIDLATKTEDEWLPEIYAAITGIATAQAAQAQENLEYRVEPVADDNNAIAVVFSAAMWAEPIGFKVEVAELIRRRSYQLVPPQAGGTLSYAVLENDRAYGVALPNNRLSPKQEFAVLLGFEPGVDLNKVVSRIDRWDGSGATQNGIGFL